MTLPRTVGLFLGPYRNLTTLIAAVLHLHPRCQALNHAGGRVFGDPSLDFLVDHSDACFARFVEFAVSASQGGRRGNYGGSITLSHAFESEVVRAIYRERYGEALVKPVIESIVWKESLYVAQHLRGRGVDVGALLGANPRLRFLVPVRNPLDCAASNLRTGHAKILGAAEMKEVVRAILGELAWTQDLARRHGAARFFHFFEDEVDDTLPARLAGFLELDPDPTWIADARRCLELKRGPDHDPALLAWYRETVAERFDGELAARLLRVVDYRSTQAR